jgi:hypothetical protein
MRLKELKLKLISIRDRGLIMKIIERRLLVNLMRSWNRLLKRLRSMKVSIRKL